MSSINIPQKTDQGWVVDIPAEIANTLGVAEGSIVVLHAKEGSLEVEILPPPSPKLKASSQRIFDKYKDAFEEMKRLGD
jgi:bifunctional DNA-binding transcriptional regulator/antitoxin component of YhaV-PrlF toxin-antitoxin module